MNVPKLSGRTAAWRTGLPGWLLPLLLLLALACPGRAQRIPPPPNPPRLVNDLAGLMQPAEADALERKLVAYDDSTSSQIAVVTVNSLDGDDIADYAQQLYESWGIGRKGKNNGILVLVAKQEHQARIQTGLADSNPYDGIDYTRVPLWSYDHYHASSYGYYLEALVVFARVTGVDPRTLGAREAAAGELGLSEAETVALQQAAQEAIATDGGCGR